MTLHHGDCLEIMAGMEPESVDAIVTDPPYGLEFMGKEWDNIRMSDHEHYWVDAFDDETGWHCTICGLTEYPDDPGMGRGHGAAALDVERLATALILTGLYIDDRPAPPNELAADLAREYAALPRPRSLNGYDPRR